VNIPGYRYIVANKEHSELAREIAHKSITLIRNENDILPLNISNDRKFLAVIISDREGQRVAVTRPNTTVTTEPAGAYFAQRLQARYNNIEIVRVDPRSNQIEYDSLLVKVSQSDVVIGASFVKARSSQGNIAIQEDMRKALISVTETATPFVLISFGDPYFIKTIPNVDAYICAYSAAEASVEAAVETLVGVNNPSGRLPITIPDIAPYGMGLKYSEDVIIVEELEMIIEKELQEIDDD
jgi:beta-N-acetylhexosaminidase